MNFIIIFVPQATQNPLYSQVQSKHRWASETMQAPLYLFTQNAAGCGYTQAQSQLTKFLNHDQNKLPSAALLPTKAKPMELFTLIYCPQNTVQMIKKHKEHVQAQGIDVEKPGTSKHEIELYLYTPSFRRNVCCKAKPSLRCL